MLSDLNVALMSCAEMRVTAVCSTTISSASGTESTDASMSLSAVGE